MARENNFSFSEISISNIVTLSYRSQTPPGCLKTFPSVERMTEPDLHAWWTALINTQLRSTGTYQLVVIIQPMGWNKKRWPSCWVNHFKCREISLYQSCPLRPPTPKAKHNHQKIENHKNHNFRLVTLVHGLALSGARSFAATVMDGQFCIPCIYRTNNWRVNKGLGTVYNLSSTRKHFSSSLSHR